MNDDERDRMNDDERDRMRHTAEALRQARGRVLQGSSNFLDIVQVIETFGREHWKKKYLKLVFDSISGNTEARIQQNQDFRW